MENEQIEFKCERCFVTSRGVLGFSYSRKVFEMKKYEIVYMDGVTVFWDAEKDTLKDNVLILSKKKEQKGMITSTAIEPELVVIIPLFNVRHWRPVNA